jgi:hypothetical protein
MKKIFAVVVCCALFVSNVSAQDASSIVDATSSAVALTSAQEPAPEAQKSATDVAVPGTQIVEAPATYVAQDPAAVEVTNAPTVDTAPMVSGAQVVTGSGCGCGGGVVTNYAAPMAAAPSSNCCQPVDPCCSSNQNRGFRGFRARMASRRTRGNDCCCN